MFIFEFHHSFFLSFYISQFHFFSVIVVVILSLLRLEVRCHDLRRGLDKAPTRDEVMRSVKYWILC